MQTIKRFFFTLFFFSLLGAVLVAWFSPQLISWYFTPPADIPLSCKASVDWGILTYRKMLVIGALMGAIAGLVVFLAFVTRKKTAKASAEAAPAK